MAIDNFIPTVWSARLIQALTKNTVFASLMNRNWEPVARTGARTVRIGAVTTDITVGDYTKNTDISDPQVLDDTTQDLVLDQQKYFNFYVDDIDRFQSVPDLMSEAMRLSAVKIGDVIDLYAEGIIRGGVVSNNRITNTTAFGSVTDGYFASVNALKLAMDEANIPTDRERFLVVPPKFISNLTKYIADKGVSGNLFAPATTEETLRNGFAGRYLGFRLYVSNNVHTTTGNTASATCLAGTMDGATFAEQISEINAYRPEKRFGDAVKGLYVYAGKVINPAQLYSLTIRTV